MASAINASTQKLWIIGTATAALVVRFAFGTVVPTRIAQSVPESWHRPEQRAADVLQRGEWDAGMRLLQVADPARLRAMEKAALIVKDNASALADCHNRAEELQRRVQCKIAVGIPSTDRPANRESVPRQ
ncbi:DUF6118 family protein [Sphingomonas sp. HF-S4]|uniref:DUF6118 family protein n=1 Tax=Sphingomonas agrestis TaxID=3080540 RepID=A0ABU3Y4Z6_9SPHN|nr:DUF6118 family protein [Sphingomonas sp. HF-S4]MDV3456356.1 DUF6118 family protein [Sphingomonas sp. HF-S4]